MFKKIIIILACVQLSACATRTFDVSSGNISNLSTIANSPLANNVSVGDVQDATIRGPKGLRQGFLDQFKSNIQKSLNQNGMLANGNSDYLISAEIIRSELNISYKSDVEIRYKVTDTRNGELVMDEIITGSHTAKFNLNGTKRLIEATEGSLKANITEFIQRLTNTVVVNGDSTPPEKLRISLHLSQSKTEFLP